MQITDIRWQQRFNNFNRAFGLLSEIIDQQDDILAFESIVKEGIIQRFQYTFELAWKTLKDKMEYDGILIERVSPKFVFKLAFQHKYITSIDTWLKMCNDRNLMSHTYHFATFDLVLTNLQSLYYPLLADLHTDFIGAQLDDGSGP
jgi:nucleotidyltransferase substrate binding protein (TIGR01987 family)